MSYSNCRIWRFQFLTWKMVISSCFSHLCVTNNTPGSDMRLLSTSIIWLLCDQIFLSPIHWTKATNFPASATHAIDLGPGGLSGLSPLTAQNWWGVGVIVAGDHRKGDVELYNLMDIIYEAWVEHVTPLVTFLFSSLPSFQPPSIRIHTTYIHCWCWICHAISSYHWLLLNPPHHILTTLTHSYL